MSNYPVALIGPQRQSREEAALINIEVYNIPHVAAMERKGSRACERRISIKDTVSPDNSGK